MRNRCVYRNRGMGVRKARNAASGVSNTRGKEAPLFGRAMYLDVETARQPGELAPYRAKVFLENLSQQIALKASLGVSPLVADRLNFLCDSRCGRENFIFNSGES